MRLKQIEHENCQSETSFLDDTNRYKVNDIQVFELWKLSHAVRRSFLGAQSERRKQFLSAVERQKGAANRPARAPQISRK
jgi:hypothetical protein